MDNKPVLIYKNIGETPLEAIDRLRKKRPDFGVLPMTYAGRLDPLAEGLLLVLVGDDCNKKDEYLGLSKEYEMEILFGFQTDTYDLLGLLENEVNERKYVVPGSLAQTDEASRAKIQQDFMCADGNNILSEFKVSSIKKILLNFIGDISQEYPPYSSKTVNGKPLWQWARDGKLDEIEIPKHIVNIADIKVIEEKTISKDYLGQYIEKIIPIVLGDFRQDEILAKWKEVLKSNPNTEFQTVKIKVSCGSGAYMRVLANDMGKALNLSALAFHIKRTKIGDYSI